MRSGRSEEEIRALAAEVTEAVARAVNVPSERVRVLIRELEASRIAQGGVLRSDAAASPTAT
jgi:4-oxalocrotonate tautomerase family enzyme